MEKPKSITEARKEKFDRQAKLCRELADLAMAEVDDALFNHYSSSKSNYEHVLGYAVVRGEITAEQASEALANYEAWVNDGEPGFPITDSDTLASPIGHYVQQSILD